MTALYATDCPRIRLARFIARQLARLIRSADPVYIDDSELARQLDLYGGIPANQATGEQYRGFFSAYRRRF